MTRLLVVSSYPFVRPIHGGQRRLDALVREYRRRFPVVDTLAVYNPRVYGPRDAGRLDIGPRGVTLARIDAVPQLEDLHLGRAPSDDPDVRAHVRSVLARGYDVIVFEQPYLFLGMRDLIDGLSPSPRIVYGSQNLEAAMKRDIYAASPDELEEELAAAAVESIEELERDLARRADLVLAVSESDAEGLRRLGAREVVVVPNGVDPRTGSRLREIELHNRMVAGDVERFALFTGSAHPPNASGLLELLGTRLGYLDRRTPLYLAGDVGARVHVELDRRDPFYGAATFWRRAVDFGRVDEPMMARLLSAAGVILLPITSGGGSNLKTAEAIHSGARIVATSTAFRGFDRYRDLDGVVLADTPEEFQSALVAALGAPPLAGTRDPRRDEVVWSRITSPAGEAILRVAG